MSPAQQLRESDEAGVRVRLEQIWGNRGGLHALSVVNHGNVAQRYLVTGALFFLSGGIMAMLMRTQLALPQHDVIDHQLYNQLFTMHGTVMMFLFAVPMMEALAVYLIPKMIGARDLAFPRLSAFGYWCYLFGGIILLSSLFFGIAPDAGWFMYTPLSSSVFSPGSGSDFWLLGITFVEISAVSAGVELIVSILRTRTAGMRLDQMPLFAWYVLATALMIVTGFPPLILGSILLELERAAGLPFFDVSRGGDPILWQHLFWLFGHPEVYIIFLPAAGIVSTLVPVFAQRPIVGYRWAVLAVISTAFISFGLWVHHMFTVGIPQLAQSFFSAASMVVAIPTGIQVFVWLATLWYGRPRYSLPMLWLAGFFFIFVAGGFTGVMLALVPFDWQVHDTHFVVAHFHYVLIGGMLFPLVAGLYFWLPHFSGRMPSPRLGRGAFWCTFIGFNVAFLVMHWTGLLGMPRRVYTYDAGLGWDLPNLISSLGGFVLAIGSLMVIADIALHFRFGRRAGRNPWQAGTLEWAMPLPAPSYNFASQPHCDSRDPLWQDAGEVTAEAAADTQPDPGTTAALLLQPHLGHGLRETLGTDAVSGQPREIIHLPGNSWLPLLCAIALAALCLALLAKSYAIACAVALLSLVLLLRWSWLNGAHPDFAPFDLERPGPLPFHSRSFDGPGRWGMIVTLLASGSLYMTLLFAWLYLWTIAPAFVAPERSPLPWLSSAASVLALAAATRWHGRLLRQLKAGSGRGLASGLLGTSALGALHLLLLGAAIAGAGLSPRGNAHDALLLVLLLFALIHSGLALLATLLQWRRVALGCVGIEAPFEVTVVLPLWQFSTAVHAIAWAAIVLFPLAWPG